MDSLSALKWRYATKKFDSAKKISEKGWSEIEDSLVLTPSSYGLQPWKFVVVKDAAVREKLKAASWNQAQVTDASHFVVFARAEKIDEAFVDAFVAETAKARGATPDALRGYRDMMVSDVVKGPRAAAQDRWASNQVYIALGQAMLFAAGKGIDACPLEGLDPAAYDKILGLEAKGLRTCCALALGYRAADDKYASAPKVRSPKSEVVISV